MNINHSHIGYYENGYDIEAVTYQNEDNTMNVHLDDYSFLDKFDTEEYRILLGFSTLEPEYESNIITPFLFNASNEKEARSRFYTWVTEKYIPFLKRLED
jgi:hypothetical protein